MYKFTRSSKPYLLSPIEYICKKRQYISASKLRNFMINDHLIDYLKISKAKSVNITNNSSLTNFIINKGVEFERSVVKYINDNIYPVQTVSEYITDDSVKKTKELIMSGVPIIHSAPLRNNKNFTYGIADLIVRSDYINKLVKIPCLKKEDVFLKAPKLNGNYHYLIVDIKFSTLPLCSNGENILNSENYPYYKVQTYIYTQALANIQGYESNYAFILGRRYRYTVGSCTYNSLSCLDKLGIIDYGKKDNNYISKTKEAINWIRNMDKNSNKMEIYPKPSNFYLYPNICAESMIYNSEKQEIAHNLGEITMLWYCGIKQREIAFKNGITSWRDKNCSAYNLGVYGKRAKSIDAIIKVNRSDNIKIIPVKKLNSYSRILFSKYNFYVDFETMTDIFASNDNLPIQNHTNMIFMIGVSYFDTKLNYVNFIAKSLCKEEELRIMKDFMKFISSFNNSKIYYWSAERQFWNKACSTHNISSNLFEYACDLCDVFKTEPIAIKGCFNFKLKDVSKAMRNHGFIKSKIESECDNGMCASIKAWNAYNNSDNPSQSSIMNDISKYNEFDCNVLYEIVNFLVNNYK